MQISFKTRKLQEVFNSDTKLQKMYGKEQAKKIKVRLGVLLSAVNLEEVPKQKPDRCHPLKGKRQGQYAVDLCHPFRLIFKPVEPFEYLADGSLDLTKIMGIIILGVEDYHGD
jgi:proteic killer suppression protein